MREKLTYTTWEVGAQEGQGRGATRGRCMEYGSGVGWWKVTVVVKGGEVIQEEGEDIKHLEVGQWNALGSEEN